MKSIINFKVLPLLLLLFSLTVLWHNAVVQAQSRSTKAPRALVAQMVKDDGQANECLATEYRNDTDLLGSNLKVRRIDLNRDGKTEFIVHLSDACQGGQNSPIFVYQRVPTGYKLLLTDSGNDLSVRRTSTGGYHDIAVVAHGSAIEHEITIYKFRSGKYQKSRSFTERAQ